MMSDLPQRSGACCTRESHDLLKRDAAIIAECRRCQSTIAIHAPLPARGVTP